MTALKVVFVLVVVGIAILGQSQLEAINVTPIVGLVALGFASARFGRLVTFNGIFADLRRRFGIVPEKDSSGAGDSDVCRNPTPLSDLLMCPICTSTWGAMGMLFAYFAWKPLGIVLVLILAATGIGEVLIWSNEVLEWAGRLIRVIDGEVETIQRARLPEEEEEPDVVMSLGESLAEFLEVLSAFGHANDGNDSGEGGDS